jgi:hypothetical protein
MHAHVSPTHKLPLYCNAAFQLLIVMVRNLYPWHCIYDIIIPKGDKMKVLEKIFLTLGICLVCVAVINKFFVRPHLILGVKLMSLILLANVCLLLAILIKLYEKK